MNDVTMTRTSGLNSFTHKSEHMMTWLLKNEFISENDSRISKYRYRKPHANSDQSDISLRKRVLQNRMIQLTKRRRSLQNKNLELTFRRENIRRKANALSFDDDTTACSGIKPRLGLSSFSPVKKYKSKTTATTQTSSTLLTKFSKRPEILSYMRNGVRCTWC